MEDKIKQENKEEYYLADCNICMIKQDGYVGIEILTVSPNCKTHRFGSRFGTRTAYRD